MPHLFRYKPQCSRYYAWFQALHTRVDLLLIGPLCEEKFEVAEASVSAELHDVEHMGNRFDPDSELSRAVRGEAPDGLLSPELYALLARCLSAWRETGGLFDITVNSPGFTPGLIESVELIPSGNSGYLRLHHAGVILDLSGILKGYALERLRLLLPTLGINDALVSLGNSSILSLGSNPSDIPPGQCLTTSGNATAERRHIRNPLTGAYVAGTRAVSVTTANAVDGEIASIVEFLKTT